MAESQLLLGMFTLNDCRVCATKSIYVTSLVPLQQKFVQLAFCIAQRSKQLEANNNEWPWNRGILLKLKTKLPHANVFCVLNNFYFYKMATNLNQTPIWLMSWLPRGFVADCNTRWSHRADTCAVCDGCSDCISSSAFVCTFCMASSLLVGTESWWWWWSFVSACLFSQSQAST